MPGNTYAYQYGPNAWGKHHMCVRLLANQSGISTTLLPWCIQFFCASCFAGPDEISDTTGIGLTLGVSQPIIILRPGCALHHASRRAQYFTRVDVLSAFSIVSRAFTITRLSVIWVGASCRRRQYEGIECA